MEQYVYRLKNALDDFPINDNTVFITLSSNLRSYGTNKLALNKFLWQLNNNTKYFGDIDGIWKIERGREGEKQFHYHLLVNFSAINWRSEYLSTRLSQGGLVQSDLSFRPPNFFSHTKSGKKLFKLWQKAVRTQGGESKIIGTKGPRMQDKFKVLGEGYQDLVTAEEELIKYLCKTSQNAFEINTCFKNWRRFKKNRKV